MDLYSQVILYLAILYISLSLFVFVFRRKQATRNVPPGKKGWPIVGESPQFMAAAQDGQPEKFVNERTAKYSPEVFRTSLLGEDVAVFCGPLGNKFLFTGENKYVTTWLPPSMKKVLLFPETIKNLNEEKKLSSHLPESLKPEALRHYIPIMDSMTREYLERDWSPYEELKVFPSVKNFTLAVACRLFMNIKDPNIVSRFANPFAHIAPGLTSVPVNIPGTPYNKAVEGGKVIRQELLSIVRQRKKELSEGKDVAGARDLLSRLLLEADDDGNALYEMETANKITGLLVASHDSTGTAITMVVNCLAQYPHIYEQVYKEQMKVAKSKKGPYELLTWEDIQKMKYSWNVARESLRLTPPGQGAFRQALTDVTFAGFTIPKGWKIFWTVYSTHKNSKYFTDPEKFDPSRFEGSGPAPFTFVPFGGGPHMCPGKEYAKLEILIFMHNLVTKFKFKKVDPQEKIVYNPSPNPTNDLLIRLQLHN